MPVALLDHGASVERIPFRLTVESRPAPDGRARAALRRASFRWRWPNWATISRRMASGNRNSFKLCWIASGILVAALHQSAASARRRHWMGGASGSASNRIATSSTSAPTLSSSIGRATPCCKTLWERQGSITANIVDLRRGAVKYPHRRDLRFARSLRACPRDGRNPIFLLQSRKIGCNIPALAFG